MSPPVLRHIPPDAAIGVMQLSISSMPFPNCIFLLTPLSDLLQIVISQHAASVFLSVVGLCEDILFLLHCIICLGFLSWDDFFFLF